MNATEERAATVEEAPRCHWGRSTPEPCPRTATVARWSEDEEPSLCAEHATVTRFTDKELDWLDAEDDLRKLLRKARKRVGRRSLVVELLEEALEEAGRRKAENYRMLDGAIAVANSYKGEA